MNNTELRNRVILPVLLPLLVVGGVALAIGGMALVLLYTSRTIALTIALVVAAGIMVAISLANAVDEQDMTLARRSAVLMVGVLPILASVGVALWSANGAVPAEELNINKQPVLVAPEGALVGAKNDQSFCVFTDPESRTEASCEDVGEVTLPAQAEGGPFLFEFENLQANIQHNFQIFALAGDPSEASAGEELFVTSNGSELITGPDQILYSVPPDAGVEPGQYYYNCVVHPAMQGVLTVAEGDGGEGAAAEG